MRSEPILRLEGVSKVFGEFTALDQIDLDIHEGEFLTIVGPSGSGKTTLIRILVGIEELSKGKIWLRDARIEKLPANLRPTCMVFQSLALFPHKSVGENIEFPLKLRRQNPLDRKARADELLDLLHLPQSFYDKRIHECSGGERQRVALARALAFDPEILFFDEPLSALDFRLRKNLEKELKDLHQRTGKTFVYITHSLEEAMVMSDRIAIMRSGRFEQIAVADEIYARPVSRFVAEFMGEVNLFSVEGTASGTLVGTEVDIRVASADLGSGMNLAVGVSATLMVRPEAVQFLSGDDDADFMVEGLLKAEYALGSRTQYKVEADNGDELAVEKLREDRFSGQVGDRVRLGWNVEHAHLIRPG
ncbi:MAG TPA: ABC transporter ATP-binding protein [Gammaproteobacteria bacterium]|jgi:spermidine/putrescine transport system ATP-binding protein|nr:Fe3+/spermidine/putrescine ABC transporter ATP-binding protein [Acidiferrobacteraceae bacterium]MDP6398275.1 ABC transporter ATP-binding protein [Arenicellales bacterium]MDP6552112.1 ABC transporter ATP-binding protein [Arenicellales bacterium]MDP6918058.1 ABC transporter ATP-binding protein [Arenicellales bacterium]HCX86830.1 ABC transporter ATP-binding protein [Gammaproteobacteria bacterium]|tara:strand:- start:6411 stop:7496 length:1086 start_codon:yes stop_codon:yes gene_type:complete